MYVHMPGGTLEVEIKEDGMVYMVGEVGYVGHIQLGNELSEQLRIKDVYKRQVYALGSSLVDLAGSS